MSSYNFTFIIPHKNLPELLKRCVSSIPERDDIQVIIVDDSSDDVSVIKSLNRVKGRLDVVFDKESKGAGHVRNVGLDYVEGEWLLFADADDFFTEDLLSCLDRHLSDAVDIVFFRAESMFSDTLGHAPKLDRRNAALSKYAGRPDKVEEFCSI